MLATLLDRLEKLITEHGSAEVLSRHVALLRDEVGRLEKEKGELQKANADLVIRLTQAESQLARHVTPMEYAEWQGVLIKRLPNGQNSESPYCPACKVPLSILPRGRMVCNTCLYVSGIGYRTFLEHLGTLR